VFPQVATYQWDSHSFFTKILDNPTKYGFPDSTSFGSDKDFWGNNYHPSGAESSLSSSFLYLLLIVFRYPCLPAPAHILFAKDIAKNVLKRTIW